MGVIYDSKAIIPAPFVSYRKQYEVTDDGTPVGVSYTLSVQGKLSADKGSPNSSGTFWTSSGYPPDETVASESRLASLLKKQQALRSLFATPGRVFEVQPWDGSASLKCNPRVESIEFPEGQWFNTCDYVITLSADTLFVNGAEDPAAITDYHVRSASEEWQLEVLDENLGTYRLVRSISATGKRFYLPNGTLEKEAWEQARDFVLDRLGLGIKTARMQAPDVLDLDDVQAYNYLRSQSVGEKSGTFAVTESWVCYDPGSEPPAYEEWEVNVRTDETGRTSVSVDGTITGLEVRNNTTRALVSTKWDNALEKWTDYVEPNLATRASNVAGVTLNPTALGSSTGRNENSGVIRYSVQYDDRPATGIAGAKRLTVTVDEDNPADVFAKIPILGRTVGSLFQDMGLNTDRVKTVNVDVQMTPATYSSPSPSKPNVTSLILTYQPTWSTVYVGRDSERWVEQNGQYSRTVTWEGND